MGSPDVGQLLSRRYDIHYLLNVSERRDERPCGAQAEGTGLPEDVCAEGGLVGMDRRWLSGGTEMKVRIVFLLMAILFPVPLSAADAEPGRMLLVHVKTRLDSGPTIPG